MRRVQTNPDQQAVIQLHSHVGQGVHHQGLGPHPQQLPLPLMKKGMAKAYTISAYSI